MYTAFFVVVIYIHTKNHHEKGLYALTCVLLFKWVSRRKEFQLFTPFLLCRYINITKKISNFFRKIVNSKKKFTLLKCCREAVGRPNT